MPAVRPTCACGAATGGLVLSSAALMSDLNMSVRCAWPFDAGTMGNGDGCSGGSAQSCVPIDDNSATSDGRNSGSVQYKNPDTTDWFKVRVKMQTMIRF